jgi:hypothetical protein
MEIEKLFPERQMAAALAFTSIMGLPVLRIELSIYAPPPPRA